MDIKTTSTTVKPVEAHNSASASSTASSKDSTTSFKDELEAVKTQENESNQDSQTVDKNKNSTEPINNEKEQKNINNKNAKEIENNKISDSMNELSTQLETLNGIKNNFNSKTHSFELKTEDKNDYCKTIKMDNNDIKFFVNLVDNQQMSAQNVQLNNINNSNNTINSFNEIKTQTTQETVQISATLLDAINESAKTNKPFRIDFGNDVAVIMKVNKDGNLSANFIPGSAAVENYLRNNIESLKQSFNDQNLSYDELSYSKQRNQNQNQNQNNQKENKNE